MKKTIYMLPALALLIFAACSSEDAVTKDNTAQLNETPENAIGFDAYLNRTTTRAGKPGILTTSNTTSPNISLQASDIGFGVFGYYANGDLYSENATPNFMYNQWVKYDGDWKYEPVKYWPNEFGSSAISTGVDRVTFFAYAPYVGVDPTTGQLTSIYNDDPLEANTSTTSGITSLTRNGKTGDPYVRYVGAFNPANCVDLCYGVAAADYKSSIGASDGANNVNKGEPYLNVAKPEINSKIYFDFKHALAKLTVQIDADVDVAAHADGTAPDELDNKTRIWVRSITFDGIAQRGYLNLNSGMWYEVMDNNKISHASVTIHDGRRDGAEATADDSYESPTGFNDELIQKRAYTTASEPDPSTGVTKYTTFDIAEPGVTTGYQNLFAGSGSLLVIPANEQLKVTIVYDVETADATLPTYLSDGVTKGSTIENKITKYITLGGTALKLESGNAYTLNLHLGMNSVKFDAKVSDWEDNANADNTWLPENVPVLAANTPATLNVPATAGTYYYKISGLKPTSTQTLTKTGNITATWTPDAPASSGILKIEVPVNNTVSSNSGTATLTETGDASTTTTITVNQDPHSLGLGVSEINGTAGTITLSKTATGSEWSEIVTDVTKPAIIKVTRNSTDLTGIESSTPWAVAPTNDFKFNDGIITLNRGIEAGETYTIYVKGGDAEGETYTAKIGQFVYATPTVAKAKGTSFTNPLTKTGTGTVTYSSSGTHTIDANGKVTLSSTTDAGTFTITATVTNDTKNGWYYLTNTATYSLNIGDVVFTNGGNYIYNCPNTSGNRNITICGLTTSGDVTIDRTSDPGSGGTDPSEPAAYQWSLKAGPNGSGAINKADDNGLARVAIGINKNYKTTEHEILFTVTDNGKTMTITVKQQGTPAP